MAIITTKYGNLIVDDDIKELLDGKRISITGPYFYIPISNLVAPPSPEDGLVLDHINGNKNDNRRENLRWITSHHNSLNKVKHHSKGSSRYKGVNYYKRGDKWRMRIMYKTRPLCDALFINEEEAGKAFDICIEHFYPGIVNHKNFPNTTYSKEEIEYYLNKCIPGKVGTGVRGVFKRDNKFVADFKLFKERYTKEFDTLEEASQYVKHIESITPHSAPNGQKRAILRDDGVVYDSVAECSMIDNIPRSALYHHIKMYGVFEFNKHSYSYKDPLPKKPRKKKVDKRKDNP